MTIPLGDRYALAAHLCQTREALRDLLGDQYEARTRQTRESLKTLWAQTPERPILSLALACAQEYVQKFGRHDRGVMLIVAAALDILDEEEAKLQAHPATAPLDQVARAVLDDPPPDVHEPLATQAAGESHP